MAWATGSHWPIVTAVAGVEAVLVIKAARDHEALPFSPHTLITAVVLVNSALLLLYTTAIYPEIISPLKRFPRAKRWLPRKLYHQLLQRQTAADALYQIAQETQNNGLVALREPAGFSLLATKPHVLAELLVHRARVFSKPESIRALLGHITGNGLIYLEGEQHRSLRKKSLPHFSFRPVKDLHPLMWNHAVAFADALEAKIEEQGAGSKHENVDSGKVEFTHWADSTTVKVIGTTVFGNDFEPLQNTKFDNVVELLNKFFEPSVSMQLYICLSVAFSFRLVNMLPWSMNREFQDTSASLTNTCIQLVRDRREAMKSEDGHVDILSNMIRSSDFSDVEIAAQLITYMAAGNDTTSISLSWACYLLAVDQGRQSILRREVGESLVLEAHSGAASDVDVGSILERLPFLNGVISETLRLYPAVPATQRTPVHDTTLAGHHIPAGTVIHVSPWVINRSPEFWGPTADKFEPERWISHENGDSERPRINPAGGASSNYDFLTFLHGPRSCIGQGFARAELRCLLAAMVSKFEWSLGMDEKDVVLGGALSIKPRNGLHLQFKRLHGVD